MSCKAIHSWSVFGLIAAFIDLAISYTLLCVATFTFFPSKLLSFFGLYFPCPCSGIFGYENSNLCFYKLLVDFPLEKINSVQGLVKTKFPFDFFYFHDHTCNLHGSEGGVRKCENGNIELEGELCCSSSSVHKLNGVVDRESKFDAKGKRIMNQKQKSASRRRRKALLGGHGKVSTILSESTSVSMSIADHNLPCDDSEKISHVKEIVDTITGGEECLMDYADAQNITDCNIRIVCSLELRESNNNFKRSGVYLSSVENFTHNDDGLGRVGDDTDVIRELKQALEEEKFTRSTLYQELEKERAAAATAADEAMAMILRLQEDKASIEIEARQYRRMIEEKCTYDEEEMDILKEILVRREKENHFLEKELEAYRQMNLLENDQLENGASYDINNCRERASLSNVVNENMKQIPQQTDNSSIGKCVVEANCISSCEQIIMPACGEENVLKIKGIGCDLSMQVPPQNSIPFSGEGKPQNVGMTSQLAEVTQTYGEPEEETEKDRENWNTDSESSFYDVHVIDDATTFRKANDKREFGLDDLSISGFKNTLKDYPSTSTSNMEPNDLGTSLDQSSARAMSNDQEDRTPASNSQRATAPPVDNERSKIGIEVQQLRERLQRVQEEKEKLTFSDEFSEMAYTQLKIVEELLHQLQEIQQLREPTRQSSLPASTSKVNCDISD